MTCLLRVTELQIELITDAGVLRAVDGVSFEIHRGETVTIIGESGSGKSTTAMGLLGLLPEDLAVISGSAEFNGTDILGDQEALCTVRGRHISLIPQDPMTALSPVHSIGSQLCEAVRLGGTRNGVDRAISLLEQVRIPDPADLLKKYPHQLSGGMMQRVLIAIALAADPELIVADEPTSALDVTVQAGILDLLLDLQERTGIGMLMITHDLGVARLVSDRIYVMKDGRFLESGSAEALVRSPQSAYTKQLLDAIPRLGPWNGPDEPAAVDPTTVKEGASA